MVVLWGISLVVTITSQIRRETIHLKGLDLTKGTCAAMQSVAGEGEVFIFSLLDF